MLRRGEARVRLREAHEVRTPRSRRKVPLHIGLDSAIWTQSNLW